MEEGDKDDQEPKPQYGWGSEAAWDTSSER